MIATEQIMTLSEVAQYLKIAEKSVLRMVRRGELPGTKVASQWRFFRSVIDEWLLARMRADLNAGPHSADMGLSRMLTKESCLLDIAPGSKEAVLTQLAAPLAALEGCRDSSQLVERLMAREAMISTGLGRGVAIPHLRNPLELRPKTPRLAFGRCVQGTEFDAIDGAPVTLLFFPRPADDVHHVKVMARLGSLLHVEANRTALMQAETYSDIETILLRHDQQRILAS